MKSTFAKFWQKLEKEETVENNVSSENLSPVDKAMNNLIKMKEATKLLRASVPTVNMHGWDTTGNTVSVKNLYSMTRRKT